MSIFDLSGNKILNPVDNSIEAGNNKIFIETKSFFRLIFCSIAGK